MLKFILLILISISLFGCNEEQNKDHNLILESRIGNNADESFIGRATSISSDFKYIYVDDHSRDNVKQYSLTGKLLRTIGQEGNGPSEFPTGNIITASNDSLIVVYDRSGFRVTLFDTSGTFLSSFQTEKRYNSAFHISDTTLVAGFDGMPFEKELKDKYLFSKFDLEGNLLSKFGSFPLIDDEDNNPVFLYRNHLAVSGNLLHVAYQFIPLYQIYDIQKERLLKEYNLYSFEIFEQPESGPSLENMTPGTFQKSTQDVISYSWGVEGFQNQVFILHGDDTVFKAERFEISGDSLYHSNTYSYPMEKLSQYGILDFTYVPKNEKFYFLTNDNVHGFNVSIFAINNFVDQDIP